MIIHNATITGSLTLDGIDISSVTGSAAVSSSLVELSSSFIATSSSLSNRVTTNEQNIATLQTASSSLTARVNVIETSYATTGSNQFSGSQSITGSLTVTGQVIAQTLNVQQVTSSIVYSSGSNIFGNSLANTQVMTGSLQVTGSAHSLIGNVGIFSTTPASFLHIGTYGSSGRYVDSSTLPSTPANHLITLSPPSTTGYYGGGIGWSEGTNTAASINAYDDGAGGALGLVISTGNNTSITPKLTITSTGNVGINSLGTNAKLEVVATSGEIFRADANGGALRIVADQTGVTTQGTLTHLGTISVKNTSVPALQLYRDLDVTSVGPAGQGVEFGARSGASTYVAGAAIYGGLDNPTTTGTLTFQTRTANSLTTKLSILSTGEAIFTGRVSTGGGGGGTANLNAQQASGDDSAVFAGGVATAGSSKGIKILAGTNSSDYSLNVRDYSGNIALYVRGDRNVGIGTTSPTASLHIIRALGSDAFAIGEAGSTVRFAIGQETSYTGNYINSQNIDLKIRTHLGGGTGGNIIFQTANDGTSNVVERVRITSGGDVQINTTNSALGKLHIAGALNSTMIAMRSNNDTSTGIYFTSTSTGVSDNYNINHTIVHGTGGGYRIEHNATSRWIRMIAGSGGVELAGTATSWTAISDIRKKDILQTGISNALDKISSIDAIFYKYKNEELLEEGEILPEIVDTNNTPKLKQRRIGLIAQQIHSILPEAVTYSKEEDTFRLSYTEVIPLLVESIKELKAENDTLKEILQRNNIQ